MGARLCGAAVLLLLSGAVVQAADPPQEIQAKVKAFEESVQKSKLYSEEVKKAVKAGEAFYGRPAFFGANHSLVGFGSTREYFTFWLFNQNEKPSYRAYYIEPKSAGTQTLMKAALFAFERKARWVAVYPKAEDPDQPLYIAVYP